MKSKIIRPKNPAKIILVDSLSWRGGSHISLEKTLYDTVLSAIKRGMSCFQFFLGSPLSFSRKKFDLNDITRAVKLAKNFDIQVISHSCYLYNLNGSSKQLCWCGDTQQDGKTIGMIKQLEYELSILSNFEGGSVVIHPGSYQNREEGMDCIAKTINKIKFPEGSMLLLENCAGEGNKIPRNFKEIKYILDKVEQKNHVGICIDTAHIHGQGDYDLSDPLEVIRMFEEFNLEVGLDKLKLIHLNDSEVVLGAKRDKHELIGQGKIWGKSICGFKQLIHLCKKYDIPTCLETSPNDMDILFQYDTEWEKIKNLKKK